jgi:hypothetical protein
VLRSCDLSIFAARLSEFDAKLKKAQESESARSRQARAQNAAVEIMTGVSQNKSITPEKS